MALDINPNFVAVGQAFVQHYYQAFDRDRTSLAPLYSPLSMMTFEGEQFQGSEAIIKKLVSLPFATVQHITTTVDYQPTQKRGVLVFVVGQLKTDNDPPHGFSQTFQLLPTDDTLSSYYILNDAFRLSLHNA